MEQDRRVNPRVVISGLWISTLFNFVYVDLFSFFREDVVSDALAGRADVFTVSQTFLALTTLYILPASLMVFLTLVLPSKINRIVNVVLAVIYAGTIVMSCVGETWIYYFIGSAIELILLTVMIWLSLKTL